MDPIPPTRSRFAAVAPWQMAASGQESPNGLCCGLTAGCGQACTSLGSGSYEIMNQDHYSCQSYNSGLDNCNFGPLGSAYCGIGMAWNVPGCPSNQNPAVGEVPRNGCTGTANSCGEGA